MANSYIKERNSDLYAYSYREEVLIGQKPGGPILQRLHRYLEHNHDKTERLNLLGRSVVRVSDNTPDDYGGSGFFSKFCLTNDDEFYALVTNEHVIGMEEVCSGKKHYIFSELLRVEYPVHLPSCPFVLCSPPNFFPEEGERIARILESGHASRILPNGIAIFEGDGPYLDVTVIELNENLVNQIGDKIFVLEYPLFKDATPGTPRHLCISTGAVGNYLNQYQETHFEHTADTLLYSSGSPVLRWDGTVCGVHRAGDDERVDTQGKPDHYNVAAAMNVVLERLQAARSQNP